MCACVKADKRFITSRVRLIGGMNVWEAEKVNVTVHNQRVEESIQTVSYEQVMAAPTDMSGKNWYVVTWLMVISHAGVAHQTL